ncbi:MAG TPA: thiamine phosphate synthase [Polyangia bacterium]|nr:thiamine phosphate synthase [Polyangia bacterium]
MNKAPFLVYVITELEGADAAGALAPSEQWAIQLRDREASGAALLAAAERLARAGHRVYVNDRVDVALAAGCEGVQLGGSSVEVADARALGGPELGVGVSIHAPAEAAAARAAGADFCVLAPIFASPGKGPPLGLGALAEAARAGLPVYALGGVDESNAAACLHAGAAGVAAIRAGLVLARLFAA